MALEFARNHFYQPKDLQLGEVTTPEADLLMLQKIALSVNFALRCAGRNEIE